MEALQAERVWEGILGRVMLELNLGRQVLVRKRSVRHGLEREKMENCILGRAESVCYGDRAMQQCSKLNFVEFLGKLQDAEGDKSGEVDPGTAQLVEDLVCYA